MCNLSGQKFLLSHGERRPEAGDRDPPFRVSGFLLCRKPCDWASQLLQAGGLAFEWVGAVGGRLTGIFNFSAWAVLLSSGEGRPEAG